MATGLVDDRRHKPSKCSQIFKKESIDNFRSKNPFDFVTDKFDSKSDIEKNQTMPSLDSSDKQVEKIVAILEDCLRGSEPSVSSLHVATKSIVHGVIPWVARALLLVDKLPPIQSEVVVILRNIFDLYMTTAFRIFTGNLGSERVLLGIDQPQLTGSESISRHNRRSSSPNFGFGLRPQPTKSDGKPTPTISSTLEAELCSLVEAEKEGLDGLRKLIAGGQSNLKGIAKFDLVDDWISDPALYEDTDEIDFAKRTAGVLEMRTNALLNCVSLGLIVEVVTSQISDNSLIEYRDQYVEALPVLFCVSNRINAMRAIRGKSIVMEVSLLSVD